MNKNGCSEEGQLQLPLALFAVERNSKKRLLFDVSSRKVRGISSVLFPDAFCESQNGGWLLMVQHKPFKLEEQIVFLVHPSTGRRIDLPLLRDASQGCFVAYIDSRGNPLVVACIEIMTVFPTVHITCPGDVYWCVYKHIDNPFMPEAMCRCGRSTPMCRCTKSTYIIDVALIGTQAVCVESHGQILIFDVTEMTWRTVSCPEWTIGDAPYLVASNTEVVLISWDRGAEVRAFKFFKLDVKALEWSSLDDGELDNTSWFLWKGQSFRVSEEGKRKVYTFGPDQCKPPMTSVTDSSTTMNWITYSTGGSKLKSITNIYVYDLVDGTVEMVIPASIVTEVRGWVQSSTFATPAILNIYVYPSLS